MLVEAGHRCAIPTCRAIPVEINHIVPWATVKEHKFDNLIVLCANCHARYTKGAIDRKAMQQYKSNLGLLTNRYNSIELRMLEHFAKALPFFAKEQPEIEFPRFILPGGMGLMCWYLLTDGMVEASPIDGIAEFVEGIPLYEGYKLTPKGKALIERWFAAEKIDST
ncbi:HNH endonuclease signature motif containing protein [Mycolicibacterium sp. BK556]|uniref:HNH endonuclease signature motif containing protein n=1 Tax=Mycolicibacterium sp. BK556 TaxID=2587125 RepID=UPI001C852DB7